MRSRRNVGTPCSNSGKTYSKKILQLQLSSLEGRKYGPIRQSLTKLAYTFILTHCCSAGTRVTLGFSLDQKWQLWALTMPSWENVASSVNRIQAGCVKLHCKNQHKKFICWRSSPGTNIWSHWKWYGYKDCSCSTLHKLLWCISIWCEIVHVVVRGLRSIASSTASVWDVRSRLQYGFILNDPLSYNLQCKFTNSLWLGMHLFEYLSL